MRPLFILGVLFAMLLTFYSALWHKSEQIEEDITTRVTADLDQTKAKGIAVDVDGRHITLSGIVYDEKTEQTYLDTATRTYGALGPIDGLTVLGSAGFLKAVKSDAGITLTGAVPSQEVRVMMLEAAAQSTSGDVVDAMTVGAPTGAWTDEAGFGLSQMAGLSSGALAVTPDSYTLSGTTSGDATALRQSVTDRAGWSAFVSAPNLQTDMTAQIAGLQSDVAQRDGTISALTTERDGLARSLAAMTLARDAALQDQNAAIDALGQERDALLAANADLTGERDTAVANLQTLRSSLDETQTSTANLSGELASSKEALEEATAALADKDATIEGLNSQVGDLSANVDALTQELEGQRTSLSDEQQDDTALRNQITALTGELAQATGARAETEAQVADLADQLEAKAEGASAAMAQVATLSGQVEMLKGKAADMASKVEILEGEASEMEGRITGLTAVVAQRDATIQALSAAKPDTTTASVANPMGPSDMAAQCGVLAGEVLQNAQINFSSGTANLRPNSIATMERMTGIALACADNGLSVEIGGHTDSQGSDENNQVLSENRAKAVAQFMIDRGVPADTLMPVGYGEAQPIGDNETREGRQQNRRISFEWQAR